MGALKSFLANIKYSKVDAISIAVFFVYFFLASIKHFSLHSGIYDLGLFTQFAYLAGSFDFWDTTSLSNYTKSPYGDHFSLILLPIGFIIRIFPSAYTLLFIQSAGIALLIRLFLNDIVKINVNKLLVLGIALLAAINPFIFNNNLNEFHPEVAFAFFGYLSISLLLKNQLKLSAVYLLLYLLTKEAMFIFCISYSLLAFFRKKTVYGVIILIVASSYFLYASDIVSMHQNYAIDRYGAYGSTFLEVLGSLAVRPWSLILEMLDPANIKYTISMLMPVVLLIRGRISFQVLAASIPIVLSNILSSTDVMINPIYQYQIPLIVFMLVSIANSEIFQLELSVQRQTVAAQALLAIAAFVILSSPGKFFADYLRFNQYTLPVLTQEVRFASTKLKVWSHPSIASHFAARRNISVSLDSLLNAQHDVIVIPKKSTHRKPDNIIAKLRNWILSYGEIDEFTDASVFSDSIDRSKYVCESDTPLIVCRSTTYGNTVLTN